MLGRGLVVLLVAPCLWGASNCSNTTFSNTNITCVQSNNQFQINQTVTLNSAPITFGDSLVVLCRGSNAVTAFSITDSTNDLNANHTWTALTPMTSWATAGSPSFHEQLFWVQSANFIPNSSPPGNQNYRITCNSTGGAGTVSAAAWQFHSPTGIISIDTQSTFRTADSVTGSQSIAISPTQSNDLLFAVVDHTGTMTAGSGFTSTDTGPLSEAAGSAAAGSTSVSYSLGGSQSTVGLAIAFAQGSYPTTPFISRTQATDCLDAFPCLIAPTGAGHFLVAALVNGLAGTFSVSGGCATSWVADTQSSTVGISIFHCSSALGGATSITMTPIPDIFAAAVVEYSVTPGYTIQRDPGANALATTVFTGSTSNPQTARATTTGADDVVVAMVQAENDIHSVMPTPNGFANPIPCGCGGAALTDALNVPAGFNNQATMVIETNQGPGGFGAATVAYEAVSNNQGTLPSAPTSLSVGSVGSGIQACDVNDTGSVTVQDVQLAINMDLNLSPCTLNINGSGTCNVVTVQRIINADLGMPCVTGPGVTTNSVSMSWAASTSPNISGYNVYRGATAAGTFSKMNSTLISGTSYTDTTVQPGQTYYYVVTAVNSSNSESQYSSPAAQSVIPSS